MKIFMIIIRAMILSVFVFGVQAIDTFAYAKDEAVMIKVEIDKNNPEMPITITPDTMTIEKKTIVIWVNLIDGPEIDIEFEDPTATIAATMDQKGFYKDDKGGFSAKYMPHIATSSIRFIECGTFVFKVKSEDGKKTATGKVIVK